MTTLLSPALDVRKSLGRVHLNDDHIPEALEVFTGILQDHPNDVESYVALGDCCLVEEDGDAAAQFYAYALGLAPANDEIKTRLRLAQAEGEQPDTFSGVNYPDSAAILELLKRLTQRLSAATDGDVEQAARLLAEISGSDQPASAVAGRLDEITALLPALLTLNIQQARAEARPDIAASLHHILESLLPVKVADDRPPKTPAEVSERWQHTRETAASPKLLFVQPGGETDFPRQQLSAQALAGMGCETSLSTEFPSANLADFDAVVISRPHGDARLLEGMALCKASGIPLLLDLDLDFERMPLVHPDYEAFGLGTRSKASAFAAALLLADQIIVPNKALAATLQADGYPARVIPDGWMRQNEMWEKPAARRHTLNLGWLGGPGQLEDVASIRRIVIRVLREFPHTRLVIGGDPQIYHLFDSLPESRRLFLPPTSYEDHPYTLGQIDILLAPLCNTPFNRSTSDRVIVDAGVRGIPWVGSPVPAFLEWGASGLVPNSLDEWHTYLRQLVLDEHLRASLGAAGQRLAARREMNQVGKLWLNTIQEVMTKAAQPA